MHFNTPRLPSIDASYSGGRGSIPTDPNNGLHPPGTLKNSSPTGFPAGLLFLSKITLAARLAETAHPPKVVLLSDIPGLSIKTWNIKAFGFVPKPYTRGDIAGMVSLYRESVQGR